MFNNDHRKLQKNTIVFNIRKSNTTSFAVRETASLGIMGEPRVPPLSPSESIVLHHNERERKLITNERSE